MLGEQCVVISAIQFQGQKVIEQLAALFHVKMCSAVIATEMSLNKA